MSASGFGMGRSAIIGVAVAASLCSGALAQDSPALSDAASAMIGAWEFSNADHDKICRFMFRADAVADGHKLDIDKNCAKPVSLDQGHRRLGGRRVRRVASAGRRAATR